MSKVDFKDNLAFDQTTKTVVSVRDGILEYYGQELDIEPLDKVFKVYRTPATIANLRDSLINLPVTVEHVSQDGPVSDQDKVGSVQTSEVVDLIDNSKISYLGIKNRILLDNNVLAIVQTGKNQISLGYSANLIPSDIEGIDFEQKDIQPHQMSIVDFGRCGSECSFIDRAFKGAVKEMTLLKCFTDEDGNPNLAQIVEIVKGLPEAIKNMPGDELQKVLPMLQDIVSMGQNGTEEEDANSENSEAPEEEQKTDASDEDLDMDKKDDDDDQKKIADSVNRQVTERLAVVINDHTNTLLKSREFLDNDYAYKGKSTLEIQKDVVATQYEDAASMTPAEVSMAFKLIKRPEKVYDSFKPKNEQQNRIKELLNKGY